MRSDTRQPTKTLLILLLLVLGSASPAAAESPRERAAALFKQGNSLHRKGLYGDALKKYRQARAIFPSYRIDLNIGGALDAMGRHVEAAVFLETFLLKAAGAAPDITDKVQRRLAELRRKLGRVRVTSDVDGVEILADARSVGRTPLKVEVYFRPGSHRLTARRPGHEDQTRELRVAAGQAAEVTFDLKREPKEPASRPAAVLTPAATRPAGADRALRPAPSPGVAMLLDRQRIHRSKSRWFYGTLGLGAALTISAAVALGVGISGGNEAHDLYEAATTQSDMNRHWSDVESANTTVAVGVALMGTAAVAYGVALYMLITRPSLKQDGGGLTFAPTPGGLQLRLTGL